MFFTQRKIIFALFFLMMLPIQALAYVSNGSGGAFIPGDSRVLDVSETGVFNFTSIFIDADVNISFNSTAANPSIYLLATEDIIINGSIDVSDFFDGAGGNLTLSTPGTVQINGSLSANGNPNGGCGGTITIESGSMVSLGEDAFISVAGNGGTGTQSNGGSVTLVGGSAGSVTLDFSTSDGILQGGVSIGSGDLELNPVPVPSAIFLLASGVTGLLGLNRRQKS